MKRHIEFLMTLFMGCFILAACSGVENENATQNKEENEINNEKHEDKETNENSRANLNNNSSPDHKEHENIENEKENDNEKSENNDATDSETEEENSDEKYKTYENGRFGFSIDYPTSFDSDDKPDNDDGIELHNEEAKITASGSHAAYTSDGNIYANEVDSIESVFDNKLSDLKDEVDKISYQKLDEEGNWFVISYVDEESIIYKKTMLAEQFFAELKIEYPKESKNKYEPIVKEVVRSFTIHNANE